MVAYDAELTPFIDRHIRNRSDNDVELVTERMTDYAASIEAIVKHSDCLFSNFVTNTLSHCDLWFYPDGLEGPGHLPISQPVPELRTLNVVQQVGLAHWLKDVVNGK